MSFLDCGASILDAGSGSIVALVRVEREAGADPVVRSFRPREAFIKQKFVGSEYREALTEAACGFEDALEFVDASARLALFSSQCDVRMIRAVFRGETAPTCRSRDHLLEMRKLLGNQDVNEEDAGTIEEPRILKADGNTGAGQPLKLLDDTRVLRIARRAEKLQSDVPAFGARPAEAISGPLQTRAEPGELLGYRSCQRDSDEQAHTVTMRPCGRL